MGPCSYDTRSHPEHPEALSEGVPATPCSSIIPRNDECDHEPLGLRARIVNRVALPVRLHRTTLQRMSNPAHISRLAVTRYGAIQSPATLEEKAAGQCSPLVKSTVHGGVDPHSRTGRL